MPKQFLEFTRFDGGLNTYFDEEDIGESDLADVSLWSVSKPGRIYSISRNGAQYKSANATLLIDGEATSSTSGIAPGYGFIVFDADYLHGGTGTGVLGATRYAAFVNDDGYFSILEALTPTSGNTIGTDFHFPLELDGTTRGSVGSTDARCRMIWAEGALRISDSLHSASTRVKWFGRVVHTRFIYNVAESSASPSHEYNEKDQWHFLNADCPPPQIIEEATDPEDDDRGDISGVTSVSETATDTTSFGVINIDSDQEIYPTGADRGKAINVGLQKTTTATDGGWEATDYEFAQTLVYQGNQESVPALMQIWDDAGGGDAVKTSLAPQQYWTSIQVYASVHPTYGNFDPRVTGARIYIRKFGANRRWTLFLDADFSRGVRQNTFEDFTATWVRSIVGYKDDGAYVSENVYTWSGSKTGRDFEYKTSGTHGLSNIKNPSPQTYESINGYSPDQSTISFESATQGWEHAAIVNRRCFTVGMNYVNDVSGSTELMSDRVFYSAVGKYDIFPVSNWLDLGVNDGESFTAVVGFSNRLLAFKQTTLYIINVQNPNDGGWYLESELKGMGVSGPNSIAKTDKGVIFANVYGLYIFDGKQTPVDVSQKLDKPTWKTDLSEAAHSITVGYDGVSENVIIGQVGSMKSIQVPGSTASPYYVYDIKTKSFVRHEGLMDDGITNFSNIPDTGELVWGVAEEGTYSGGEPEKTNIMVYDMNTLSGDSSYYSSGAISAYNLACRFITKTFDFGSPALLKKFYNLYINLACNADITKLEVKVNDETAIDVAVSNTSGAYVKQKVSLSSIAKSSTFKVRIILFDADAYCSINNMTLEYRTLYKRES